MGGSCGQLCWSQGELPLEMAALKAHVIGDVVFDEASGTYVGDGSEYGHSEAQLDDPLAAVRARTGTRCGTGGTSELDLAALGEEGSSQDVKTDKARFLSGTDKAKFSGSFERQGTLTKATGSWDAPDSSLTLGQTLDLKLSEGPRLLSVNINKTSPTEKLGFSVSYRDGQLSVLKVEPSGAVARQRDGVRGGEFQKQCLPGGPVAGRLPGRRSSYGPLGLKAQISRQISPLASSNNILTGDVILSVNGAEDIKTINRYMMLETQLVIRIRR